MQNLQLSYPIVMELGDVKNTKLRLMKIIAHIINTKYKTQKKAASILNIDQPKVSQINRLKVEGFSLEYLLDLLVMLDQDVKVQIKHSSECT